MSKDTNSYRSILKGTAMFGGVQVFNILINLLRGKFIAILLGPEGMGISSLLTTASNTIQQFSSLGLNSATVKEVAAAKEMGQDAYLSKIVCIIRDLLRITAVLGAVITIILSSYLSQWTFGTEDYTWHFRFISIVVFFTTMANGELSILQGLHAVKNLAFASVIGSLVGLFAGIPLYYFWGYNGIVPAMIILSISIYIFYRLSHKRLNYTFKREPLIWKEKKEISTKILILGFVLMIAALLGTLTNYLLNACIRHYGSLEDVGLYQASYSITSQYAGLVFTAMALDFFPRLSAIASDNNKVREIVNQQSEIVVLAITPIITLVILLAPLLIKILLTNEFLTLIPVVRLMAVGLFFKAILFPMGYISFSKGDKKFFFWLEGVWGNCLTLSLNVFFYLRYGIWGIGVSFVVSYSIFVLVYLYLTHRRYQFYYTTSFLKLSILLLLLLCLSYGASLIKAPFISYICMGIVCITCILICLYNLNVRLQFIKKR